MSDVNAATRAWWKVRGEAVGLVGLIGDIIEDWGRALAQWSNRHLFTERELEHLTSNGGDQ